MGNMQGALVDNHNKATNTAKFRQSLQLKSRALARFLTTAHRKADNDGKVYDDGSSRGSSLKDGVDNNEVGSDADDVDVVDGAFTNVLLINSFDNEQMDEIIDKRNGVQLLNESVKSIDDIETNIVHMEPGTSIGFVRNIVSGK